MRVTKPPEQRRAELVAAARVLFDEKGVENTRVSDIVAKVGVAQGVFYYYFSSKNEMVQEVARQVGQEVQQAADAILAQRDSAFGQKLAGFIQLYVGLVDQFTGDDATRLPEGGALVRPGTVAGIWWQTLTQKLLELVEEGARRGDVTARRPAQQAKVLLWGLLQLSAERMPGIEEICVIAEDGLGMQAGSLSEHIAKNKKENAE